MSAEVLAFFGTTLAALIAMYSAIFTANQGKKAQVVTAEKAAEMADRESQRAVQMRMLELLGNEGDPEQAHYRAAEPSTIC